MTRSGLLAFLAAALLAACAEEGTYPLSGESCAPDDPVIGMDAGDCAALPAGGGGTF